MRHPLTIQLLPHTLMKKTLFLTAILSLISMSTYAEYTADVFLPQSIITVQQGEKADRNTALTDENYRSSTNADSVTMGDVLTQAQQYTTNYSKRSAIVKDGQGELVISGAEGEKREAIDMSAPLLVREGTLSLSNVSITNTPKTDGSDLAVGGINANLVLDNAQYSVGSKASSSSSVNVGGVDGDGVLTLKNGSTLYSKHNIFLGSDSIVPFLEPASGTWDMNPHRGGSYQNIESDNNERYRTATDAAGFANIDVTAKGAMHSTATVNVLSGSHLITNYSLYVENATLNIDGAGSLVKTAENNSANNEFIGNGYGTKSVINITNGGQLLAYNQFFMVSAASGVPGSDSEINISGKGSRLCVAGDYTLISYYSNTADSTAAITIDYYGEMSVNYLGLGSMKGAGCKDSITLTKYSTLNAQNVDMFKGTSIDLNQSSMTVTGASQIDGASITLEKASVLSSSTLSVGGTSAIISVDTDSRVQTGSLNVGASSEVVNSGIIEASTTTISGTLDNSGILTGDTTVKGLLINNGTLTGKTTVTGTLKGSGTMGETNVSGYSAYLIVGNSPGKQIYTGDLTVDGSSVVFSVDELLHPQPADSTTSGWGSDCYSVIDMQGHNLEFNNYGAISITLSSKAIGQIDEVEYFEMVFASNIGNVSFFTDAVLAGLKKYLLIFEEEITPSSGISGTKLDDSRFEIKGNNLVWVYGEVTPEPATATLSLLALAGLAARRRRK